MCRRCPPRGIAPAPKCPDCGAVPRDMGGGSWLCTACGTGWCEYITFSFQQGPIDEPVEVKTPEQFAELFGDKDPELVDAAKLYLEQDEPHPTIKRIEPEEEDDERR